MKQDKPGIGHPESSQERVAYIIHDSLKPSTKDATQEAFKPTAAASSDLARVARKESKLESQCLTI